LKNVILGIILAKIMIFKPYITLNELAEGKYVVYLQQKKRVGEFSIAI
jgi:hypothetical protein